MSAAFSVSNNTRNKIPRIAFKKIKEEILGKDYILSLVFVNEDEIAKLNKIYRNKNKPTDILSFPLDKNQGEIYICPKISRSEAVRFERKYDNFLAFIFIHGCVHLIGHDHGSTMESIEKEIRAKFRV